VVDGISRNWTFANSGGPSDPYTEVHMNCPGGTAPHGASAMLQASFNLGVDRTVSYTGSVHFKVGYCDGDTCEFDYAWNPALLTDMSATVSHNAGPLNPRIFGLGIRPVDSTASIGITLPDSAEIVAITANYMEPDSAESDFYNMDVYTDDNIALYTTRRNGGRATPTGGLDFTVNIVYTWATDALPVRIPVMVTYYDASGRELGHAERMVTGTRLSDVDGRTGRQPAESGISLNIMPNPANGRTLIDLRLPASEMVTVVVTDLQGREVRRVVERQMFHGGAHLLMLDTDGLASGTYVVTATTEGNGRASTLLKVTK
jgi:hypothetical protein